MKIRTKLNIFPISLVIIMLIVSLLITMIISNNTMKNQAKNHLLVTTNSKAHDIETQLKNFKDFVQVLAVGIPFTNVLDPQVDYTKRIAECNLRIKRTIKIIPNINGIRILNKNGIVIASSTEDIGIDLSEETIFINGRESIYIGEIYNPSYSGNLVLNASVPIYVRDKFSGVLNIDFDIEKKLFDILSDNVGFGETGKVYLVNKDAYIITPSMFIDAVILKTKLYTLQSGSFKFDYENEGYLTETKNIAAEYIDYTGKKVLGTRYYISEMQWGLIAEIDVEEIFNPIFKQSVFLISYFLALLIITIIVAAIISRNITSPIIKLHKGTKEIIKGNLDHKVQIESKDEIGELSYSFDIMTDKLKKAQKELKNHTEDLETTVKKRTAELKKQFKKSEKQRIATLVVMNDLNATTKELKAEITERKKSKKELEIRLKELEIFYQATIGREGRIIELKQQVNELLEQLGKEKKYNV